MVGLVIAVAISAIVIVSTLGSMVNMLHAFSGNNDLSKARVASLSIENLIINEPYEPYTPPTTTPPPTPYTWSAYTLPSTWSATVEVQNVSIPSSPNAQAPTWSTSNPDSGVQLITITLNGPGLVEPYSVSFMKDRSTP